jgi:glyoxylase-like metal-dependent hydrolase (beta-lactamase superfamily II)
MSIHHLNCGTMRPYWPRVRAIVYCLLVECDDGLVLIDTGFGLQDCVGPTPLMRSFTALLRVPRSPGETAARQVVELGLAVEDVRHIVLTHLHLDHAGGLPDFPEAQVHVYRPEYEAAMRRRGLMGRFYRPEHWAHGPRWVLHDGVGERWLGFGALPIVEGLSPRILLVPLPGHTPGHCGVAVETPSGWLLHCGDAASPFARLADPRAAAQDLDQGASWGARFVRWTVGPHVSRLRALAREHPEVELISGHDRPAWLGFRSAS